MTELAICSSCGEQHSISDIELSFKRPDDFLLVPREEREQRTQANNDLCAIWGDDDASHRYFVRGLLPLSVEEWGESYSVGVWLEVSRPTFDRIRQLWSEPDQTQEPAFPATLANALPFHASTSGLAGNLHLTGPDTRPEFQLHPAAHTLFLEQEHGISAHRASEYSEYATG
ncbi:DUF2199 domain-containing protein [Duganella sp. FT80W]|uniref:DUF2199 domain-containing protein n=1 Tax=Duganella guangzhouensis TaxID=2666084 RepID=A0A6I2KV91_9BURK|nr:DUF2199 domain-containing protein [Duganella guangzhouensis]MRW89017.1 DUF2199 domain-containing protein [Duganella guangzhouensis]